MGRCLQRWDSSGSELESSPSPSGRQPEHHSESTVRKQRDMNAGTQHTLSFSLSPGPQPRGCSCRQLGCVLPSLSAAWKLPHGCGQRFASLVTLDPVKLTVSVKHQTLPSADLPPRYLQEPTWPCSQPDTVRKQAGGLISRALSAAVKWT